MTDESLTAQHSEPPPVAPAGDRAESPTVAQRALCWSGAGFLFAMPFTSSVAVRNVALGIALVAALVLAVRGRSAGPRLPRAVLATLIIWAGVCAASWLWSVDPAYTAGELRPELLLPLIAFGVFWVGSRRDAVRVWCTVLLAGAALLGAMALGEFALTGAWNPYRLHAGVGAYSTWLVMVFPLVLTLILPNTAAPFSADGVRWPLFALLLVLVVGSAYLTQNRIVWPAFAAVLFVFCALYLRTSWINPRDRRALLAVGALVLAGLVATLIFVTAHKANVNVGIDTPTVQSGLEKDARLALWRYAAERVAEAPIAGHGFGRGILRGTLQSTLHDRLLWHGHNVFLNVLLQTGMVGLAAFLALLAALASRFVAYAGARSAELNAIGIIGLAFLAGFLVKNLTDDFFVRHTGLLFWSMNGMLIGYGERLLARISDVSDAHP